MRSAARSKTAPWLQTVYPAGVGATADLPAQYRRMADEGQAKVLDMRGKVVTPGLINTHHHMYQSLTRAVPAAQDAELFSWLQNLYMLWLI